MVLTSVIAHADLVVALQNELCLDPTSLYALIQTNLKTKLLASYY